MENKGIAISDKFLLNGEPFKIISGGMHYFRVVPEYWRDRLQKLKAMGCNTVETYVAWNLHEPKKGEFCFSGTCDILRYIQIAQELGLYVIVRPGPYICGEWEFGGLPAWLLAEDGMRLRTRYAPFLAHVEDYFKVLLPKLVPLQADRGGPVILFQVENEYGYYGDDTQYLEAIRDMLHRYDITVPLITSDGPNGDSLACGSVAGALPTANFGSKADEQLAKLKRHLQTAGGGPQMCMEFWVGWFDHWGSGIHSTADAQANAKDLDEILRRGSVNIYMFHGGTNFGFMNGSNYYEELTPDVTSYDYDAPLSEDGRITEKYRRFQEVIKRHISIQGTDIEDNIARKAFGTIAVKRKSSLFAALPSITAPIDAPWPICMEKLGQSYGYTLYSTVIEKGESIESLRLTGAADRALVFADGRLCLTLYDRELLKEHPVNLPVGTGLRLDILVENMGRVNYGARTNAQRKGIDGDVLINGHSHTGWRHYCLPMQADALTHLDYNAGVSGAPAFHQVPFDVNEAADTFLDMEGWGKGCVLLNGFNIGRFWDKGPQRRLYIPAPLLCTGHNELLVFETEGRYKDTVTFAAEPDLGPVRLSDI